MKFFQAQIKMLLKKKVLLILFFFITFFSCYSTVLAANFKYADFDFETFAKKNLGYWTSHCSEKYTNSDDIKDCEELVLSRQEEFYTRLYKLLAKYESQGLKIDDKIIIETAFFELDPDMFTDDGEEYETVTGTSSSAYNLDAESSDYYDIDAKTDPDYFINETDTLQTLLKAMIAYPYTCYGIFGTAKSTTSNDSSGSTSTTYSCSGLNGEVTFLNNTAYCTEKAESGYLSFWEMLISSNGLTSLLGISTNQKTNCSTLGSKYTGGTIYSPGTSKTVTVQKYWDFLESSTYFDKKAHLQYRYSAILKATGHTKMTELSSAEYTKYNDDIVKVRTKIVEDIQELLENYGDGDEDADYNSVSSESYWWPIGSSETTTDADGNVFASGDPVSVTYGSGYGMRIHPITGEYKMHYGIDLTAGTSAGVYNVIASKDGIVTTVNNNCKSFGDTSCGGGYGNYIIISHADGNYTLYAHLHENTITVSEGQSVSQGQVIAKMGSSGSSTGVHLHFEVRTGADQSTAVDPLDYIDPDNPRPTGSISGEFGTMLTCLESSGPDDGGSNYLVYDDAYGSSIVEHRALASSGTFTVGPGITLKYQQNRFTKYGIDVMSSSYYYEGAKIAKTIVDSVYLDVISANYDSINSVLSQNGISLEQYQIDALALFMYNVGSIKDFVTQYQKYGNTEALYTNFFSKYTAALGSSSTLSERRSVEWNLFNTGKYSSC